MDQINSQGNNNLNVPNSPVNPTPPAPTNIGITQDYLVTQKVDTSAISNDQISQDLAALKEAELTTDTDVALNAKLTTPKVVRNEDLPLRRVKEIDVLKLKNPFRGV